MATPSDVVLKEDLIIIEVGEGFVLTELLTNPAASSGVVRQVWVGSTVPIDQVVVYRLTGESIPSFTQSSANFYIIRESDILMDYNAVIT